MVNGNWTGRTLPTNTGTRTQISTDKLGNWFVGSSNTSGYTALSTNHGVTWTRRNNDFGKSIAVAANATRKILPTSDSSWFNIPNANLNDSFWPTMSPPSRTWVGVAYQPTTGYFVGAATSGNLYRSLDGEAWVDVFAAGSGRIKFVAGADHFMAIDDSGYSIRYHGGAGLGSETLISSGDASWKFTDIAWGNGAWIATEENFAGGGQYHKVWRSTNGGYNWTQITVSSLPLRGIATNGTNTWVAVGDGGMYCSFDNGVTWEQNLSGTTNLALKTVAYGAGVWGATTPSSNLAYFFGTPETPPSTEYIGGNATTTFVSSATISGGQPSESTMKGLSVLSTTAQAHASVVVVAPPLTGTVSLPYSSFTQNPTATQQWSYNGSYFNISKGGANLGKTYASLDLEYDISTLPKKGIITSFSWGYTRECNDTTTSGLTEDQLRLYTNGYPVGTDRSSTGSFTSPNTRTATGTITSDAPLTNNKVQIRYHVTGNTQAGTVTYRLYPPTALTISYSVPAGTLYGKSTSSTTSRAKLTTLNPIKGQVISTNFVTTGHADRFAMAIGRSWLLSYTNAKLGMTFYGASHVVMQTSARALMKAIKNTSGGTHVEHTSTGVLQALAVAKGNALSTHPVAGRIYADGAMKGSSQTTITSTAILGGDTYAKGNSLSTWTLNLIPRGYGHGNVVYGFLVHGRMKGTPSSRGESAMVMTARAAGKAFPGLKARVFVEFDQSRPRLQADAKLAGHKLSSFKEAGKLRARARLDSDVDVQATAAGRMFAKGKLKARRTTTFNQHALLKGVARVKADETLKFLRKGKIKGRAGLISSENLTFNQTGRVRGRARSTAEALMAYTQSGVMYGQFKPVGHIQTNFVSRAKLLGAGSLNMGKAQTTFQSHAVRSYGVRIKAQPIYTGFDVNGIKLIGTYNISGSADLDFNVVTYNDAIFSRFDVFYVHVVDTVLVEHAEDHFSFEDTIETIEIKYRDF